MVSPSLEAAHVNMSGHMQHTIMKDILPIDTSVHVVESTQATTPMYLTLLAETFTVKHPLQKQRIKDSLGEPLVGWCWQYLWHWRAVLCYFWLVPQDSDPQDLRPH